MPLYEITPDSFRPISQSSFPEQKMRERGDLQRLLRSQIEVLGDDLFVLTEEFGDREDSRRRIDLLALDAQANLVVIELKRTPGKRLGYVGLRPGASPFDSYDGPTAQSSRVSIPNRSRRDPRWPGHPVLDRRP